MPVMSLILYFGISSQKYSVTKLSYLDLQVLIPDTFIMIGTDTWALGQFDKTMR